MSSTPETPDTAEALARAHQGGAPTSEAPLTPEATEALARSTAAHHALGARPGVTLLGEEVVVVVVYPGFDTLDVMGPHYFLSGMLGATVHLATTGAAGEPVVSSGGVAVVPTTTLEQAPATPDVLLVPGGDTDPVLADERVMAEIARLGAGAGILAGVCTGTLLLAAAGLLVGRRATSHWVARHLLPDHGAVLVEQRVVDDGDVITAAGVTSGMDLALHLAARLRGQDYARFLELAAEYAPQPPFGTGTPDGAGPELTAIARDLFAPVTHGLRARPTGQ